MTGKSADRKENKQILQHISPVTSKCLAMVVSVVVDSKVLNGKEIFDDFQLRNSTCYWNSALSESIRNLQYLGFLEPTTVLLGGSDVCLENLRMAWGRRVLNDPHNCRIEKIGDIGNITMQEVPQNHFIPLPEILCLIILDLNNKQILATVDIIQAQLKKCYQGTQLPSNQLVYETLHSLIQERKIFHTGSGYFVVTPDTLRFPVDLPAPSIQPQHNPMYLPVSSHMTMSDQFRSLPHSPMTTVAMTQTLPPVRSISCQVSLANQKRASSPELKFAENEKPRFNRSHSARRYRDKSQKDSESSKKNVSVRAQDDCLISRDVNIMKSNINKVKEKGEKKSLLSKLFGKKKKVEESKFKIKEVKPAVEYATFSAQFPPPEWKWYQEQCKKQERTKDWVTQQTGKTVLSSHGHLPHKGHRHTLDNTNRKEAVLSKGSSPNTLPLTASSSGHHKGHRHTLDNANRKEAVLSKGSSPITLPLTASSSGHHKGHRHTLDNANRKDVFLSKGSSPNTLPTTVSTSDHHKLHKHRPTVHTYHEIESFNLCNKSKQTHHPPCVQECPPEVKLHPIQNSQDKTTENRVRRSKSHKKSNRHSVDVGLLRRENAQRELQHDIQTEQARVTGLSPMFSSTPRDSDKICTKLGVEGQINVCASPTFNEFERTDQERRSRKRRSKHYYKRIDNDISYEYQGRLSRKHSNMSRAMSRDSGVNCVGLSNPTDNNNVFCYNQLMDCENIKSNNLHKSMEMHMNTLQQQGEPNKNEIVCVAEINSCALPQAVSTDVDRSVTMVTKPSMVVKVNHHVTEKSSDLSKNEDTGLIDSSEQSYDTVIYNKRLQDVSRETENMTLGDSGFYSPRVTEYELDKNKNKMKMPLYKNLTYDHHELNNLRDFQKEKIVLNNEFYKEPSPSSDYQVVGVV